MLMGLALNRDDNSSKKSKIEKNAFFFVYREASSINCVTFLH